MKISKIRIRRHIKKFGFPQTIFTDFDGCLTDDRVFLDKNGHEFVAANRKDGLAIEKLVKMGIGIVIVSKEKNEVVTARANKLKIPVFQGVENKRKTIQDFLENLPGTDAGKLRHWYVGNDRNDLEALAYSDLSICPSDAVPSVKKLCDIKLSTRGGHGIFSEILSAIESV